MDLALSRSPARALAVGLAAGAVLLGALVTALLFWDDVVSGARAQAQHTAEEEAAEVAAARGAVQARTPDADSFTFGKIKVVWLDSDAAVCGQVDIEEPQDSLDGPERFVFVAGNLTLESRDGTAAVNAKWRDVCDGP